MRATDIIAKKRDGGELTEAEIGFFIRGLVAGEVADYQASAWLMAVFLRGMTPRETLALTLAMRDSGSVVDLSDLPGVTLDKHSTGGVGDKTTLVVVPILAAVGVPMLKMSGRGLGFSGGTVDKLESIPGFRTDLTIAEAKEQVRRVGAALIAQSVELAPADKILYALRDVTATIESLPLIASSIMSKKLAAGARRIVLDVKVGKGAFMKTQAQAEALARAMVEIGKGAGILTSAVLTAMEEPLGYAVGNALEVAEALEVLNGGSETEPRFRDLCIQLAAHGLVAAEKAQDHEAGCEKARKLLIQGNAARKFADLVAAQGGPETCEAIDHALPKASVRHAALSVRDGIVAGIDAEAIGKLSLALGAGREKKTDSIDPAVGIGLRCKSGDSVKRGDRLATLHLCAKDAERADELADALRSAYTIVPPEEAPSIPASLVLATID